MGAEELPWPEGRLQYAARYFTCSLALGDSRPRWVGFRDGRCARSRIYMQTRLPALRLISECDETTRAPGSMGGAASWGEAPGQIWQWLSGNSFV